MPALKKLLLPSDELQAIQKAHLDWVKDGRKHIYRGPLSDVERDKQAEARARRAIGYTAALTLANIESCKEVVETLLVEAVAGEKWEAAKELARLGEVSALPALRKKIDDDPPDQPRVAGEYQDAVQELEAKKGKK